MTAVEWLIERIIKRENGYFDGTPVLSLDEIFDQAKEMEKKQKGYSEEEVLEHLNILIMMSSSKLDEFTNDEEMVTIKWFELFKQQEQ